MSYIVREWVDRHDGKPKQTKNAFSNHEFRKAPDFIAVAQALTAAVRNSAVGDPLRSPPGRYRPRSAVSCSTLRE